MNDFGNRDNEIKNSYLIPVQKQHLIPICTARSLIKLSSLCTPLEQRTGCRQPADRDHMQGLVVVHVCLLALVRAGLLHQVCLCCAAEQLSCAGLCSSPGVKL